MLKKDAQRSRTRKDIKEDTKKQGGSKGGSSFFTKTVLAGAAAYIAKTFPAYLESIRRDPHAATALAVTNIAHATGIVPSTVQRVVSEMGNVLGSHSIGGLVLSDRTVTSDGVMASWVPGKNVRSIYLADIVKVIAGLLSRMHKEPNPVLDVGSLGTALVPADFFKQKHVVLGYSHDVLIAVVAVLIALFIVSMVMKPFGSTLPKSSTLPSTTVVNITNVNNRTNEKGKGTINNSSNAPQNVGNRTNRTNRTNGNMSRNVDIDALVKKHLADIFVAVALPKTPYLDLLDVKNDKHCISLVKAIRNADPSEAEEVAERLREIQRNNNREIDQLKVKLTKIVNIINRGLTLLLQNGGTSEKASIRKSVAIFVHHVNSGIKSGVAKNIFMFNIKDDETKNIYSSIKEPLKSKTMKKSVKDLVRHFDYTDYVTHFMGSNSETHNYWENKNVKTCKEKLTSRISRTIVRVINLMHNNCVKTNGTVCHTPSDFVNAIAYLVTVYSDDTATVIGKNSNKNTRNTRNTIFKSRYHIDRCYIAVLATTLLYSMSHIILKKDIPDTIRALENSTLPTLQFLGKVVRSYFP